MATGVGNFLMKSVPPSRRKGALSPAANLYRAIAKEVPRILTIYDIDMDYSEVGSCVRVCCLRWVHEIVGSCAYVCAGGCER